MSDYIPVELWPQILEKLPIKTLCKCRCVCAAWNSMITSSEFIASHLSLISTINAANRRILVASDYDYSLYPLDNLSCTTPPHDLRFPFQFPTKNKPVNLIFNLIGVIGGVICLSYCNPATHNTTLVLWNPSICKYIKIPTTFTCCLSHRHCGGALYFGFGFDPIANDFKIVRLPCTCNSCLANVIPQITPVFSAGGGVWADVENNELPCKLCFSDTCSQFSNGAIHWRRRNEESGTESLLVYDCHTEQFGAMDLPQIYAEPDVNGRRAQFSLKLFNGMLAVFGYNWFVQNRKMVHTCQVWVMKEYGVADSWTNLFAIEFDGGPGWMLMGREEDEDEIIITDCGELISCNTKTREKKNLGVRFKCCLNSYVGIFKPSLLLLDVMGSVSYQEDETIIL